MAIYSPLGEICLINGVSSFTSYCSDLIKKTITPGEFTKNISHPSGPFKLQTGYESYYTGSIQLEFFVGPGEGTQNRLNADRNANNLVKACQNCVLTFTGEGDSFEYPAVLESYKIEWTKVNYWNKVTLKFRACKRLPKEVLSSGGNDYIAISNWGTIDVSCKVYCVVNGTSFQMTDSSQTTIKATGLTNGQKLTIDGIDGSVTQGTSNVMHKTDLVKFPVVKAGYNELYFSQTNVFLEYYPTFYL